MGDEHEEGNTLDGHHTTARYQGRGYLNKNPLAKNKGFPIKHSSAKSDQFSQPISVSEMNSPILHLESDSSTIGSCFEIPKDDEEVRKVSRINRFLIGARLFSGNLFEEKLGCPGIKSEYIDNADYDIAYRKTRAFAQKVKMCAAEEQSFDRDTCEGCKERKTIVLGLEGVLVHISMEELAGADEQIPIRQDGIFFGTIYVKFRPFMREFLQVLSSQFELIIFCNGSETYCNPVLNCIEKKTKFFSHRIFDSHVLFENPQFSVKYYDFLFTHGRSIHNLIIIDCRPGTYTLNIYNGLPLKSFDLEESDHELEKVFSCLMWLKTQPSVREAIHDTIKRIVLQQQRK